MRQKGECLFNVPPSKRDKGAMPDLLQGNYQTIGLGRKAWIEELYEL